ncbi:MAG: alpha/beta fold hydrolase [Aquabacterium sp.]
MKPLLLLIPGMMNTAAVFDAARAALRVDADVRVADVRGPARIADMAAHCWAALADLPAAQPLVLAGYSMGGYVALQMLATAPRPVQGLGMICSSARADTEAGAQNRRRAMAAMARDFSAFATMLSAHLASAGRQDDTTLLTPVRAAMLAVGLDDALRQQQAAANRIDQRPLLPGLALAAEIIGGAADNLVPPDASAEMAGLIPGATLTLMPGIGHLLPWEQPTELAQCLDRLLRTATHQGVSA